MLIYWNFNSFTSTFIYCCFNVQTSADISFHIFSYHCAICFTQILRLHYPLSFWKEMCVRACVWVCVACVCVCLLGQYQTLFYFSSLLGRIFELCHFSPILNWLGHCQRWEGAGYTLHPLANQNWEFAVVMVQVLINLMGSEWRTQQMVFRL